MYVAKVFTTLLAIVLTICVTGCSSRYVYTPSLNRQFEPIPEFSSTNTVTVVSARAGA